MARRPYQKPRAEQGRGTLEKIETDGPHVEWLGMPEYYIHTLTVAGQEYAYFSPEKALEYEVGSYVCFRYRASKKGLYIEKRSLGRAIDPATYQQQPDA